jgi:hypothetical protein
MFLSLSGGCVSVFVRAPCVGQTCQSLICPPDAYCWLVTVALWKPETSPLRSTPTAAALQLGSIAVDLVSVQVAYCQLALCSSPSGQQDWGYYLNTAIAVLCCARLPWITSCESGLTALVCAAAKAQGLCHAASWAAALGREAVVGSVGCFNPRNGLTHRCAPTCTHSVVYRLYPACLYTHTLSLCCAPSCLSHTALCYYVRLGEQHSVGLHRGGSRSSGPLWAPVWGCLTHTYICIHPGVPAWTVCCLSHVYCMCPAHDFPAPKVHVFLAALRMLLLPGRVMAACARHSGTTVPHSTAASPCITCCFCTWESFCSGTRSVFMPCFWAAHAMLSGRAWPWSEQPCFPVCAHLSQRGSLWG